MNALTSAIIIDVQYKCVTQLLFIWLICRIFTYCFALLDASLVFRLFPTVLKGLLLSIEFMTNQIVRVLLEDRENLREKNWIDNKCIFDRTNRLGDSACLQ